MFKRLSFKEYMESVESGQTPLRKTGLTLSEFNEVRFSLMYKGIYPNESWTTISEAVAKFFKKWKFKVTAEGIGWRIEEA